MNRTARWPYLLILFLLPVAEAAELESTSITVPGYSGSVRLWVLPAQSRTVGRDAPMLLALPPGRGTKVDVTKALETYWLEEALRRGFVVVSPEISGLTVARYARRMVPAIVMAVARRYSADRTRVIIAGIGDGGVGAAGCLLQDPDRFAGMLVLPGGPLKGLDVPKQLSGKPVYLLAGERDAEWLERTESLVTYLRLARADIQYEVMPGQGHELEVDSAKLFDWMETALSRL